MTKILSVILIIILIAGGVYFTKKNMTENLSEGEPVAYTTAKKSSIDFSSYNYGPDESVPVSYIILIPKRDNKLPRSTPKLKITCPTGVSAIIPNNGFYNPEKMCGKDIVMTKIEKNKNFYTYEVNLLVTNITKQNQNVSAKVTIDGVVINSTKDEIIPPTYFNPGVPRI